MNKKYQIFKRLAGFTPNFENEFNSREDAQLFCNLCQKTEDENESTTKWHYYVVEVLEGGVA